MRIYEEREKNVYYVKRVWLLFFDTASKSDVAVVYVCFVYHSLYLFSAAAAFIWSHFKNCILFLKPQKIVHFFSVFVDVSVFVQFILYAYSPNTIHSLWLCYRSFQQVFFLTKMNYFINGLLAYIPSDRKTLMVFCSWFMFNIQEKKRGKLDCDLLYTVTLEFARLKCNGIFTHDLNTQGICH